MSSKLEVSVKGKQTSLSALQIDGTTVLLRGKLFKTAEIFDEYWLERDSMPNFDMLIAELRKMEGGPDLFTFTQRIPDTQPKYGYRYELDNYAVLPVSTYENWNERISASARRNIRASEKRGVVVRVSEYDDDYVRGIMSIYNETPIRAGRKFWHFGKSFETVKKENGTYAERSTFLAAYSGNQMVGYLKIVWDKRTAAIMQILSKIAFRDCRPNNALLAEAVRQCCLRDVGYLLYEKFDYGKKRGDSLTRFKQSNGFIRMEVPRYYVPLNGKGRWALRLGFHKNPAERIPEWIAAPARDLRTKWYEQNITVR
jgi:hypothetical protein